MAGADRVVVHRNESATAWLVQSEGPRPKAGGERKVVGVDEFVAFPDAHAAALELGIPVYVPKYRYDPLEDEPGWNEPDGAPHDVVDEHTRRMVGR